MVCRSLNGRAGTYSRNVVAVSLAHNPFPVSVLIHLPGFSFYTEPCQDTAFLRIELIRPCDQDLRILTGVRQNHGSGNNTGTEGIEPVFKGCEGDVIVIVISSDRKECACIKEASQHIAGLADGSLLLMLLGKCILVKQPFLVKLCHIFHIFLKGFGSGDIGQFPVNHSGFGSIIIRDAKVGKQQIRFHHIGCGQRYLIVRIPVSVRVLFLECLQHLIQLIQALRLLQAQIIHPSFIDPIGCHRAILSLDARQGINVSV